jgi:hypothetical protein
MNAVKPAATWAGLVVGLTALILQFVLTVPARMASGHDLFDALVFFFTFFTILTNLMLVLIYLSEITAWRWLGWWQNPVTRGGMVGTILLVMGFYHLLLAQTWDPQGWFRVADLTLHYVTPVAYAAWWGAFQPHGPLRFAHIPAMLLFPLAYVIWALLRGAVVDEYPYAILEANTLGYGAVLVNCVAVLIALVVLYGLTVLVDGALARRRTSP